MNRPVRLALASLTVAVAASLAACGSAAPAPSSAAAAELTSIAAALQSAAPVVSTSTRPVTPVIDPCQKLTKADVQPFFTVPIANELPEVYDTVNTKGCSFSANGLVATTLSIKVVGGDDAQVMEQLQTTDTQEVAFSGVGTSAQHPHGSTEFTAQEGTSANPTYCAVSTTGWKELAGKKDLADVTDIPDATATTIAQQYGTLCNKLFGSGNASPTMTVVAPPSSAAPVYTGPVLATGGTLGANFPLPQGLDCNGAKTTTDSESLSCDTTSSAGKAIYEYYLTVLPTKGFTINHESDQTSPNGELASLLFAGPGVGGFSSLSVVGTHISIMLQKA